MDLGRHHSTAALLNYIAPHDALRCAGWCPGVLGGLKTFLIPSNNFTGTITEDLLYLPAIRRIDMSNNNFFGVLPAVALA